MKKRESDHSPKKSVFHSIRFKVNLSVAIAGLILTMFNLWLLSDSMDMVERDLMDSRLDSDIEYLRDELTDSGKGEWSRRGGALYLDDVMIGDGSFENANVEKFYHCEAITGTFFYTFVRTDNDGELGWEEDGGYQQGHYLRVAGTTKGADGERIEGTYIDKKVADALEASEDGSYSGKANVTGRSIYCHYELLKDKNGENVGVIVVGRSEAEMSQIVRNQKIRGIILIAAAMLFISMGLGLIVFNMLKAIKKINRRLGVVGTGTFPEEPLVLNSRDEFDDIALSVNEMEKSLKEKNRIGAELDVAKHIQASMLPCIFPAFPDRREFDIYATMNPAKEVGGDFYDFFMVDDTHIAVVMADVSGKGVPAALFMVIAKTLIKDHTLPGKHLGDVFTEVNDLLCESNSEGMFVTAFEGVLDLTTGEFAYVNAGHEMPFIGKANGTFVPYKIKAGFVLAGMEGMRYTSGAMALEPGDKVFLYTDGVTEATNAGNELYGMERLGKILAANADAAPTGLLPAIKTDIDTFVGDAPQFDDITMLCLEYRGYGEEK